ncbi:hypothetical protein MANY_23870 [Mycolicibacterium anyangense]|uniref:Prokaryotic cytochrome C oxidase subunit IV family protein n=2 Tax=Mycolicibacterium anyangense TaxID=1431246 RepID=A0A6N4W530_9MYCO|nr:hypothetical protein MANY_23870 [Mycolicibacterium anyangense]
MVGVKYVPRRGLMVWALMVGLAILTWGIGVEHSLPHTAVTATVLAIACLKARFIGSDFMELRAAPPLLRAAFDLYFAALYVGLMVSYLVW